MWKNQIRVWLCFPFAAALIAGCGKSDNPPGNVSKSPSAPATAPAAATHALPPANPALARFHWLGKRQITAAPAAASLAAVWRLPESIALDAQTLDKLSLAPWHLLEANTNVQTLVTNFAPLVKGPSAELRPLLEDALNQEFYLEARQSASNAPVQFAFAIRLDEQRSALWEKNLAAVIESLAGGKITTVQGGWSIPLPAQAPAPPASCEFSRAGDWTLIGIAVGQNPVLADLQSRIKSARVPFEGTGTNNFCEFDLAPARLAVALGDFCPLAANLSRVAFAITGDGQSILSQGKVELSHPLSAEVEAWNIPTNLIPARLTSFTAFQGLKPWLASQSFAQKLHIDSPPNEIFIWSQPNIPFLTTLAAPWPNASNNLYNLTTRLLEEVNPILASNKAGQLERSTNFSGIDWAGLLIIHPTLEYSSQPGGDFVVGRFSIEAPVKTPPPPELIQQIAGRKDLVAYDWELTGERLPSLLYLGQLSRLMAHKAQMTPDTAGVKWLQALITLLGNSVTSVTKSTPSELSIHRRSSCGLTALELHFLADWLESPTFPNGLHTFSAPAVVLRGPSPRLRTNAVPAVQPK